MIAYQSGKVRVECPFCKKVCITAFYKPSYKAHSVSSISAGKRITFHRVPEKYFIQGDCPNCRAKNKDIQAYYDGTYEDKKISHEERIERLKKAGLPTRIEV